MPSISSRKKVLFTSHTANFSKFNRPFMRWFTEQGWEVHYASMGEEEVLDCDRHFDIPFTRSPLNLSNIKAYKQLKKVIDREKYDIIHTHTPMGSVVTRLAARQARKKGTRVIYTAHGFHFFKGAPLVNWLVYYPIEKFMANHSDTLITINEEDYKLAKKNFASDVRYTPGVGVDLNRFKFKFTKSDRLRVRKSLGLSENDFTLIYTAELSRRKNQLWLVRTLDTFIKDNPRVHLLLAGGDSLNGKLHKLVERVGLQDRVHLLGYRKDIPQIMRVSDAAVSSSSQEGLAVNVMEAMASGLPVVASSARGHDELIDHGKTGFIVKKNDRDNFVEYIRHLHYNATLRSKMGSSAKINVSRYSVCNLIDDMSEVYELDSVNPSTLHVPHKISVVIPVYNSEGSIVKALDSIFKQTKSGLKYIHEVIAIDDGSTDGSLDAMEEYRRNIRQNNLRIISQENAGPSAARNNGIRASTGNWIAFLDSDDAWSEDKIERQIQIIDRYPHVSLVASASDKVSSTQGRQIEGDVFHFGVFSYFMKTRIASASILAEKKSIERAGYFDESMRYAEDQNLFMKIASQRGIHYINRPLVKLSDKSVFGESGLSANIKEMHRGVLMNLTQAKKAKYISIPSYFFLKTVEFVKYTRRHRLTKLRRSS